MPRFHHSHSECTCTYFVFESAQSPGVNPDRIVDIGRGPVKGMKRFHSRLYICCGIEVVVVEVAKAMAVTKKWKALDRYDVLVCLITV